MRGEDIEQPALFSYVSLEEPIPADHPLRSIRAYIDRVLDEVSAEFDAVYARRGRRSIPPENLIQALLLQAQ